MPNIAVRNPEQVVGVVKSITPSSFAEAIGAKRGEPDPDGPSYISYNYSFVAPPGFDEMLHRASIAALRIVGHPIICSRENLGQREWDIRAYTKRLVHKRDEFGRRAARRFQALPAPDPRQ
jgi:hypothetical protein